MEQTRCLSFVDTASNTVFLGCYARLRTVAKGIYDVAKSEYNGHLKDILTGAAQNGGLPCNCPYLTLLGCI